MPVLHGEVRRESCSYVVVAELAAPPETVWQLWADPRRQERWASLPGLPLRVLEFDFTPGGVARYRCTGPNGIVVGGRWRFVAVEPPARLEWIDIFDGVQLDSAAPGPTAADLADELRSEGVRELIVIEPAGSLRSRVTRTSTFADLGRLDQMVAAGVPHAVHLGMNQLDAALAEG